MIEWSDVDIAVRDAVREFVDKEVRPYIDDLESGDMEPYPIVRKLFSTFGIDEMARSRCPSGWIGCGPARRRSPAVAAACSATVVRPEWVSF